MLEALFDPGYGKEQPAAPLNVRECLFLVRKRGKKIMNKRQKVTVLAVFAAVLAIIGIAAMLLNKRETTEGKKTFTVEIVSERDEYSGSEECVSEEEFLGAFLRTYEPCIWEDSTYGFYLIGFHEMEEDLANQYWWSITVNGESATTGAEEIVLEDGATYRFELMQGW